jgi:hypothetical protein
MSGWWRALRTASHHHSPTSVRDLSTEPSVVATAALKGAPGEHDFCFVFSDVDILLASNKK